MGQQSNKLVHNAAPPTASTRCVHRDEIQGWSSSSCRQCTAVGRGLRDQQKHTLQCSRYHTKHQ
jgi:hypothetical protein